MIGFGNQSKKTTPKKISSKVRFSKETLLEKAFQKHSIGDVKEAEKLYQIFLSEGYTDPGVFSNLAIIYKNTGRNKVLSIILNN